MIYKKEIDMKAVIFIPTLTAGGAERVASILANEWSHYKNVSVTIILLFDNPIFYSIDSDVKVVSLGMSVNVGPMKRMMNILWSIFALRKAIKAEQPDFVLSFMQKYNVFCLASVFGTNIPITVAERDSPTEKLPYIRLILLRLLYGFAKGTTVQSQKGMDFITHETSQKRIKILQNPIAQLVAAKDRKPEKIILNVGRFVPKKGHKDLLHAFAALDDPEWTLVLCGDGPLRAELESLALELGIQNKVTFMGTVTDVSVWLARAGVFAFTSYREGFPNALAEAMIAGLPVVSYDCDTGPSEMIDHKENGFLVPVGDINGFTEILVQLIQDDDLRHKVAQKASQLAQTLAPITIAKQYFEFCTEGLDE